MTPFGMIMFKRLTAFLVCLITSASMAHAKMITQLVPSLTVSEEYKDNYYETEDDPYEEWITTYELGFSLGFIERRGQIYLAYNPAYKDYKNLDDRDGLEHNASMSALFQATKHTTLSAGIIYESGQDGNYEGESWQNSANASVNSQLTKTINASLSYDYSNSYDQQVRTGEWKEHRVHNASTGVQKAFGAQNSIGANLSYETDAYKNSDADEYTSFEPTAFLKYWFTRRDGMETNLEYIDKKYDTLSSRDYNTTAGDIRYIRKFSKQLDGYIKYRHYYSDRENGNHTIYHPSVGVDWDITEDSGISIGVGVLCNRWDNSDNEDSDDPFLDLNAYKVFNFSPKGSFSITASSSYDESDDEAASLGYVINYRAGCSFSYMLTKHLSSRLFASYKRQDYKEKDIDRQDDTYNVGGGLTWNPLRWLQLSANASHVNFETNDASRDDYKSNVVTVFIRISPEQPIRPDKTFSKEQLDNEIFDYNSQGRIID
ncbi:outer membrane beta-barrel protein [uncultured Desulfobacter sp.]|uniref:outer membrane beta-barrel protein n=1 Tax=uncultured Desulfobacter sp. TaxID=240139 RepID=UPI002AAB2E55|nr:outer membrane beta-barrel protein [uncultured Desulfobacter sp.]